MDNLHGKVEQIAPGLTRECLFDGRIVIFKPAELSDTTVEHWIAACLQVMKDCAEAGRPMLIMQDLTSPGVIQTPYSREQGNTLTNAFPELGGRTAFLLSKGSLASIPIGRYVRGQQQHFRERCMFGERDEALKWLCEALKDG